METNKIYLGDAYKLIKEIPDKSIDLIYTDIPYEMNYNGGGCLEKNMAHNIKIMNEQKEHLLKGIDYSILDEFVRVLKKIYVYIWCSKSQLLPIMKYFIEKHNCFFELLVWHKTNPVPTTYNKYVSDTEYCLMFRENGTKLYGNYESKTKYFISAINQSDKNDYLHPTIKPLEFVEKHILNSTIEGGVVFDPFCGSGTTCLAAKYNNRKYIGFELEPKWHKIAVDRLNGIDAYGQMSLLDTDFNNL